MNFFIMFTIVISLGCTYICLRLIPRTSLDGWKRVTAYALCYLPLVYLPVRYTVRSMSNIGENIPDWLNILLFTSHILIGSLSIVATIVFISDIILLAKKVLSYFTSKKKAKQPSSQELDLSRRQFLHNSLSTGIVLASGAFIGYGLSEAMGMPTINHVKIPIQNLPPALHGFIIAQLTDLHINKPIPINRLENIVTEVNNLNPDTVVITGDLSDSLPWQVRNELEPLRHLKATHGKYFVSGNHEYYTGIESWLEEVDRLGLRDLHNEHHVIEQSGHRLLMCGVPDISAPRMSNHASNPILAQNGSKPNDIKVLLAHQPQSIYKATQVNYDLQISGHTHGGQIIPWTYVTDYIQPYFYGLYQVENTQLYVSRGAGYWGPPLRIGAPAEVAILELVPAKS